MPDDDFDPDDDLDPDDSDLDDSDLDPDDSDIDDDEDEEVVRVAVREAYARGRAAAVREFDSLLAAFQDLQRRGLEDNPEAVAVVVKAVLGGSSGVH